MKSLFIAEKPSVAQEFARALKVNGPRRDGYIESDDYVVTWCVGHLVTMSYPEKYDMKYKKWSLNNLPFLPEDTNPRHAYPSAKDLNDTALYRPAWDRPNSPSRPESVQT